MPTNETNNELDYKPISAWGYVGYQLLFAIPLVGLILLIVFACGGTKRVNLKNFARSYFCAFLVAIAVIIIAVIAFFSLGIDIADLFKQLEYSMY